MLNSIMQKKIVIPGERCRLHITYFCTYVLIIVLFFAPFDTKCRKQQNENSSFFSFYMWLNTYK